MTRKRYRIFTNDVGRKPDRYSGLLDVIACTALQAVDYAKHRYPPVFAGEKYIALPHSRRELWPDGKTGRLPADADVLWRRL